MQLLPFGFRIADSSVSLPRRPAAPQFTFEPGETPGTVALTFAELPAAGDAVERGDGLGEIVALVWRLVGVDDSFHGLGSAAGTYEIGLPAEAAEIEVAAVGTSGRGAITRAFVTASVAPVSPFVVTANPVLSGSPTEGDPLVYTPLAWTGDPGVTVTDYLVPCEDTSKTGPGTPYPLPATVPFIAAPKDCFFIRSKASGPGVADPDASYDSAAVSITALAVTPDDVSVASPPLPAAAVVKLKSVTNATFPEATITGRATITAGSATAQVIKYVAATGMLYLGPITNGPIAADAAITCSAGGAAVADGASAAWAFTAGEAYYVAPPIINGTPASISEVPLAWWAQDSAHAVETPIDLTGTFFKWLGSRYVGFAWDYTGQGVAGVARSATAWLPIGIPTLESLPKGDWFPITAAETGGKTRLVGAYVWEGHDPDLWDDGHLTLSSDARLESVQFPTDYEPTTYNGATTVVGGRTFVRRDCGSAIYGGKDYFVFTPGDAGDESRAKNLGLVPTIGGARPALGERNVITLLGTPEPTTLSGQERLVGRSPEQAMLGEQGGNCMQFPRGKDAQGDRILLGHDVLGPTISRDAAETWEVEHGNGLLVSQTCSGILMDYPYAHGVWGSLFMRSFGNYGTKDGLYRLDWTTMRWSLRKALDDVQGSNSGQFRRNQRYIAKVAGSGSGPATRTLYALHVGGPYNQNTADVVQVYRANANGGDSWAAFGAALPFATFGIPYEIIADATALYVCTQKGLWRRPVGTDTWTKATGLGTAAVYHIEKHGSTVYACTPNGLFKAADAATLAFSSIYSGTVLYFSICPTNPNRRVLVRSSVPHQYTTQGDSGWTAGSSQPYPGQPGNFQHNMTGPTWVQFHDTDPNIVFAMRNQHPGKSPDGGKTFVYASKNYDYSEMRDIAVSPNPDSYNVMLGGATDRLAVAYNAPHHAQDIEQNNKIDLKDAVDTALGKSLSAYSMAGTLILERNGKRRYVAQVGEHTNPKTLVVFSRQATTTRTDQAATGNGTVSVTSTDDIPGGIYRFTCTTPGGAGVGKFRGRTSAGQDMGEWTVGTQRTWNNPRGGGSITATFSAGGVAYTAGANPCVVTHDVEPVYDGTVINNGTKAATQVGQVNPAVPYRGVSGRQVVEMATDGSISVIRTIPYLFQGYMGPSGNVILASSGTGTLMRSPDEGVTWTTFASGLGNMAGVAFVIAAASPTDGQRAYAGLDNGLVKRIQSGVVTTIFDWDAWLTARGITTTSPGNSQRNSRWCPPVRGIVECPFDPNLVHICLYLFGEPYAVFRSLNAQAATPDWENITYDALDNGLAGPIQGLRQNLHTGEPLLISAKGTVMIDLPTGFRAAKGITRSLIADQRAMTGYASFHDRI